MSHQLLTIVPDSTINKELQNIESKYISVITVSCVTSNVYTLVGTFRVLSANKYRAQARYNEVTKKLKEYRGR